MLAGREVVDVLPEDLGFSLAAASSGKGNAKPVTEVEPLLLVILHHMLECARGLRSVDERQPSWQQSSPPRPWCMLLAGAQ